MNTPETIETHFIKAMEQFKESPAITALREGRVTVAHYKAVLREIYHYAKEDPQIQALATVYFRGKDRATVKLFLKHATSEIGHDLMALEDLRALGEDISEIPLSNPLPTTISFTAFPFYQIQYQNPIGYLGYLYFLEFISTQAGAEYVGALKKIGIPAQALTFVREHMTVDVAHNQLMHEYLRRLVRNDSDLQAVIYGIHVTGRLYGDMLWGAMQSVGSNLNYGLNHCELARTDRPVKESEQVTFA